METGIFNPIWCIGMLIDLLGMMICISPWTTHLSGVWTFGLWLEGFGIGVALSTLVTQMIERYITEKKNA